MRRRFEMCIGLCASLSRAYRGIQVLLDGSQRGVVQGPLGHGSNLPQGHVVDLIQKLFHGGEVFKHGGGWPGPHSSLN
jgi:hypothetical protein